MHSSHRFRRGVASAVAALMVFGSVPAGAQTYELRQPLQGVVSPASATPTFSLSSSFVNFGQVATGITARQFVTLTNNSTAAEAVTRVAPGAPFALTDDCGASLAAGASCQASLAFTPVTAGVLNATAELAGLPISLAGEGYAVTPTVELSGPFDANSVQPIPAFGDVSVTSSTGVTKQIALRNTNGGEPIISDITLNSPSGAYSIVGVYKGYKYGGAGDSICGAGGDTRTGCAADHGQSYYPHIVVDVKFKPSVAGQDTATLSFAHNGSPSGPVAATLTGNGVVPVPQVDVSAAYNASTPVPSFGTVATTSTTGVTQQFYIRNVGGEGTLTSDVKLESASGAYTLVGVYKGYKHGGAGDAVCSSGGNIRTGCSAEDAAAMYPHLVVAVKFKPTVEGLDPAKVTLKHNGTPAGDIVVNLSGTGEAPKPQIDVSGAFGSSTPVTGFGEVSTSGAGSIKRIFLRNVGSAGTINTGVALTSSSSAYTIVGVYKYYKYDSKGTAVCTAGGNTRTGCAAEDATTYWPHLLVEVQFKPTTAEDSEATLKLTHNGTPIGPVELKLTGKGVVPAPQVNVSAAYNASAAIAPFGDVAVGATVTKRIFLRNVGSAGTINTGVALTSQSSAYTILGVYKYYKYDSKGTAVCTAGGNTRTGCAAEDATSYWPHLLVEVQFKPTTAGQQPASLELTHNGTPLGPVVLDLTGTGQ